MKRTAFWPIWALTLVIAASTTAAAIPSSSPIALDANGNVRSFYGVPITLTRSDLKRLHFPIEMRVEPGGEGDPYRVYTITAQEKIRVEVTFTDDGALFGANTESPNAVGPKGIGVGSTLSDVKAAWPNGEFLFGFEDGYFVTYVTGTNMLLRFDPKDMPPGAFNHDRPSDFPVPDRIKVQTISFYPRPIPVSEAAELPNKNRSSIESYRIEDNKRVPVSKLEMVKMVELSSLRFIWSHESDVRIDRIVDVSKYADVDIYAADLIYWPEPVIISFRYGNFKNCGSREDDRDKVYVKLDASGATTSSRLPEGVNGLEHEPNPKSAGPKIGDVAHGCRRTFDPRTGASGLERQIETIYLRRASIRDPFLQPA